ncbi:hypothetical protein ACROYT_G013888 [Oculina patagonica]
MSFTSTASSTLVKRAKVKHSHSTSQNFRSWHQHASLVLENDLIQSQSQHDEAMESIKKLVATQPILRYYDVKEEMTCDKFTWNVLTTAHSWLKRRIKEAFCYIARYHPELNKQVQSLDLTLFPVGTGIT